MPDMRTDYMHCVFGPQIHLIHCFLSVLARRSWYILGYLYITGELYIMAIDLDYIQLGQDS